MKIAMLAFQKRGLGKQYLLHAVAFAISIIYDLPSPRGVGLIPYFFLWLPFLPRKVIFALHCRRRLLALSAGKERRRALEKFPSSPSSSFGAEYKVGWLRRGRGRRVRTSTLFGGISISWEGTAGIEGKGGEVKWLFQVLFPSSLS